MLRKVACLLGVLCSGVLCCSSFAFAQPDPGPGLAVTPRDPAFGVPALPPPPDPRTPEQIRAATREAYNKLLNPAGKLDLSNPEATVRSFAWSFFNADFKTARECVLNAQPYEKLVTVERKTRQVFSEELNASGNPLLTDIHSYIVGENAVVTLRALYIIAQMPQVGEIPFSLERLHLKKFGDSWLISENYDSVFPKSTRSIAGVTEDGLAASTAFFTHPETSDGGEANTQCQSNLKQISLGVMQFLQDWDEKFDLHADWKNQLQPYLKTEVLFNCPEVKAGEESYSLNNELENKVQGNWNEPSKIIMIYEGKDKKFEFRHRGDTTTNIAFADGHVKSYTKQSLEDAIKAGTVRWMP